MSSRITKALFCVFLILNKALTLSLFLSYKRSGTGNTSIIPEKKISGMFFLQTDVPVWLLKTLLAKGIFCTFVPDEEKPTDSSTGIMPDSIRQRSGAESGEFL